MPRDAILVEFARFDTGNPQGGKVGRYMAWVVPPADRGAVRIIDLGEAGPIDEALGTVRRAMRLETGTGYSDPTASPAPDDRRGLTRPGGADARLAPALESLSRLILRPLLPHIESAPRWVLSPDSSLWLVPWQALPTGGGRYAIERHLIHLVTSGRDLAAPAGATSLAQSVHFADPDFDLAQPPDAPARLRRVGPLRPRTPR